MPMRLLLFAFVAGGNALTLNRIQSVAKLLRCGDFEHLGQGHASVLRPAGWRRP